MGDFIVHCVDASLGYRRHSKGSHHVQGYDTPNEYAEEVEHEDLCCPVSAQFFFSLSGPNFGRLADWL